MSLSDCEKCWDTPCTCGHQYRKYSPEAKIELAKSALGLYSLKDLEFHLEQYREFAWKNGLTRMELDNWIKSEFKTKK